MSLLFFLFLLALSPRAAPIPNPDPAPIRPFQTIPTKTNQNHLPTIPAFPEQSDAAGCRLNLPEAFFHSVRSACVSGGKKNLRGSRCCPVLAAWLYSAYSATALKLTSSANTSSYDMPLLPDDSETCVGEVHRALAARGMHLRNPNNTCDVVYCYCGIRLHTLSCPEAFSVSDNGRLVGDRRVRKLERDCLTHGGGGGGDGFPGLGGCSKCLHSLRSLNNNNKALNRSKLDERTTKMHNKDCEMMGLTWLLAKNRTAYLHTVSAVIRAIMLSPSGNSDHRQSCALSSDGMPLAVDSSELSDDKSSSTTLHGSVSIALVITLLYIQFIIWSFQN